MFPLEGLIPANTPSFPRVRGDVPRSRSTTQWRYAFSPRARGCSPAWRCWNKPTEVFPACAGMFRRRILTRPSQTCFPRVRGDVPAYPPPPTRKSRFSPRARGCSPQPASHHRRAEVFPACAGMFPTPRCWVYHSMSFPRVRGDVPTRVSRPGQMLLFSPRARGCSNLIGGGVMCQVVFPACAGMFLPER